MYNSAFFFFFVLNHQDLTKFCRNTSPRYLPKGARRYMDGYVCQNFQRNHFPGCSDLAVAKEVNSVWENDANILEVKNFD